MAVVIRLTRTGRKKLPSYRVVVADKRMPRDGRIIQSIGYYDPKPDPSVVSIEKEKAEYWLSQGAEPSKAVAQLFRITGILEEKKKKTTGKKPKKAKAVKGPAAIDEPVKEGKKEKKKEATAKEPDSKEKTGAAKVKEAEELKAVDDTTDSKEDALKDTGQKE